jgi:hypothetical protein
MKTLQNDTQKVVVVVVTNAVVLIHLHRPLALVEFTC